MSSAQCACVGASNSHRRRHLAPAAIAKKQAPIRYLTETPSTKQPGIQRGGSQVNRKPLSDPTVRRGSAARRMLRLLRTRGGRRKEATAKTALGDSTPIRTRRSSALIGASYDLEWRACNQQKSFSLSRRSSVSAKGRREARAEPLDAERRRRTPHTSKQTGLRANPSETEQARAPATTSGRACSAESLRRRLPFTRTVERRKPPPPATRPRRGSPSSATPYREGAFTNAAALLSSQSTNELRLIIDKYATKLPRHGQLCEESTAASTRPEPASLEVTVRSSALERRPSGNHPHSGKLRAQSKPAHQRSTVDRRSRKAGKSPMRRSGSESIGDKNGDGQLRLGTAAAARGHPARECPLENRRSITRPAAAPSLLGPAF